MASWFSPCTFRCCEMNLVPYCRFIVSAVSELVILLLNIAGHMTTRRGPDVARGPDVVHHWCRSFNCLSHHPGKTLLIWLGIIICAHQSKDYIHVYVLLFYTNMLNIYKQNSLQWLPQE